MNGKNTSLWLDTWLEDKPLYACFPILFELCKEKNISLYQFLHRQGQLQFKRCLPPILFEQWLTVVDKIYHYSFSNAEDIPIWHWNKNKTFSTRSVYDYLTRESTRKSFKHIWKAKIPYKIKIFLWLVENNAILTKDNLIKRNWVGDPTCYFCQEPETNQHLFFQCSIAKIIWGIVVLCFGANNIPHDIQQYKTWIAMWLLGGTQCTQVVAQQSAGPFGNAETKYALKGNNSGIQ
jgi:hypothetical protein